MEGNRTRRAGQKYVVLFAKRHDINRATNNIKNIIYHVLIGGEEGEEGIKFISREFVLLKRLL